MRDAKIKMEGDSIAFGFTLGMTWKPFEKTTIGLGYRHRMRHKVKDMKVRTHNTKDIMEFLDAYESIYGEPLYSSFNTRGKAQSYLHLPASIHFGWMQEITDNWRVGLDISWAEQHVMEDLRAEFNHTMYGVKNSDRLVLKWVDNWRFALGTEYDVTDKLTLRCGTAYDMSAATDKHRVTKIPDTDRFWISFGAGYQLNEHLRFDLGFVQLFFNSPSIRQKYSGSDGDEYIVGKYHANTRIFSGSLTYSF